MSPRKGAMAFVAYFMPESPHWLIMKRRDEEAKQILAALAGCDVSREDESIVQTYTNIRRAVKYEVHADGEFSYRELFTGGELQNFRRICVFFRNSAYGRNVRHQPHHLLYE